MFKIGHRTLRDALQRVYVGLGICCCLLTLFYFQPEILRQADRNIYDVFLRHNGGGVPSPTPALIDIDEQSLVDLGQWPWPRHLVGKLVSVLTENGAAAIALDMLLVEPDNASVINLQKSFQKHFNITLPIDSIPQSLLDNDKILAEILAQTPTVLGAYVQFSGEKRPLPRDMHLQEGVVEITPPKSIPPRTFLLTGQGATLPLPILRTVAPVGTINVDADPDGIVRSAQLLIQVDGRILPSLALRALMRALNQNTFYLNSNEYGLASITIGKYTLPVAPDGSFNLVYRGGRNYYPSFSASDIIANKIPHEEIQGRIFIVGSSASGLKDIRATPFDSYYSGAETHAVILDNILSSRFIEITPINLGTQVETVLFFTCIGIVFFTLAPAITYLPLLALFICAILGRSWYHFQNEVYTSPLYSILTLVTLAIGLLAVRFWQENSQKRTLHNAFKRYIAPDMVTQIVNKGEAVLMGEEREVSLLFTDIRGFTSLSEKLQPYEVVHMLNRYFTPMTSIIRSSHGTVDKFIGDAVMAFWNAPLDIARHPLRAINSALLMQEALAELNKGLKEDYNITLRIGAGVHTGKVYVGNMGSAELLDYTCIGDTVNLTSRLEGLCAMYGMPIITSDYTVHQCKSYGLPVKQQETATHAYTQKDIAMDGLPIENLPYFMSLDSIRVKGKAEPIEIFAVLNHTEKERLQEEIDMFYQARTQYMQGDFTKAYQAFSTLTKEMSFTILYELFTKRCQNLIQTPPTQWDGVWTFNRK